MTIQCVQGGYWDSVVSTPPPSWISEIYGIHEVSSVLNKPLRYEYNHKFIPNINMINLFLFLLNIVNILKVFAWYLLECRASLPYLFKMSPWQFTIFQIQKSSGRKVSWLLELTFGSNFAQMSSSLNVQYFIQACWLLMRTVWANKGFK